MSWGESFHEWAVRSAQCAETAPSAHCALPTAHPAAMSVADLLDNKRIAICAGAGGVGKTTTSAAIAMGMAAQGLKVAVLTIDPAKRLANSLGLPELGNEERQVDPERFAE